MRRFHLPPGTLPDALQGNRVRLTGPDARHIRLVLRLGPGDAVRLFDGEGVEHDALIESVSPEAVELSLTRTRNAGAESPMALTIAQGFLKDKKMDTTLRQLTELGVARWIPVLAGRSVARPDERRLAGRRERWESIARAAVKQCRRGRIPAVEEAVSFDQALAMAADADLRLMFWEEADGPIPVPAVRPGTVFALLGPEGGFSPSEADAARAAGFSVVSLGPRILRAETAVVAATVILQRLFGDM